MDPHAALLALPMLAIVAAPVAGASEATVIYDGAVSQARDALSDAADLWLTLPGLTQASGFVLKPEGACLKEFCVPIPSAREKAFLRQEKGRKWFNLSELARVLHQPVVRDEPNNVWLFGPRPEARLKYLETLEAPNFTLPDWKGSAHSLSDFRGKKLLLITWASW